MSLLFIAILAAIATTIDDAIERHMRCRASIRRIEPSAVGPFRADRRSLRDRRLQRVKWMRRRARRYTFN